MARTKRLKSETGIYHIMLRGINRHNIFHDDEDRKKFIEFIMMAKNAGGFSLYAYCLMDNHVHLLIKEDEEIGKSIKRLTVRYVQWYNKKYDRIGHLFQDRYRSEVVESEAYYLTVLRYIHQNPIKAKLVKQLSNYHWSSYNKYLEHFKGVHVDIEVDIVDGYFSNNEQFIKYMNEPNDDECLEYREKIRFTDEQLLDELKKHYDLAGLKSLKRTERDRIIKEIKRKTKVSNIQLSRVVGLGRGTIQKAIREKV